MNSSNREAVGKQDNLAHIINELLVERQELLALFCRVAGLDAELDDREKQDLLQRFCEVLVDYSALWHFELLKYLTEHEAKFTPALAIAAQQENAIARASDLIVDFNDKYDASDHPLSLESLDRDLSLLGEEIASRVEAEDRILSAMSIGSDSFH